MDLPQRKHPPHRVPVSVSQLARTADFFITVCVDRRAYGIGDEDVGREGPLVGEVATRVLAALEFYGARGEVSPSVALVMPDHIHFIARFPESISLPVFMKKFKGYLARTCQIQWQANFFDHRLRSEAEFVEKRDYILYNPIRKGLCQSVEDWPYVLMHAR